jgi:hypothetical protein
VLPCLACCRKIEVSFKTSHHRQATTIKTTLATKAEGFSEHALACPARVALSRERAVKNQILEQIENDAVLLADAYLAPHDAM